MNRAFTSTLIQSALFLRRALINIRRDSFKREKGRVTRIRGGKIDVGRPPFRDAGADRISGPFRLRVYGWIYTPTSPACSCHRLAFTPNTRSQKTSDSSPSAPAGAKR